METMLQYNITIDESAEGKASAGYGRILTSAGLTYYRQGRYLHVGAITQTQGWLLHLSVIHIQVKALLTAILPELIREKVPFKVIEDQMTARFLLSGGAGETEVGKVIVIYPADERQALRLAGKLIPLTASFKGPAVPTDRQLGSVVYTRYGAFHPIVRTDENGLVHEYIIDAKGEHTEDVPVIPFVLPRSINWPFGKIVPATVPEKKTPRQDVFQVLDILKKDACGDVKKVIWRENPHPGNVWVMKEGRAWMKTDSQERDIRDRLQWQYELHIKMTHKLPIPKVYDLFTENGDTFLTMQYVDGEALEQAVPALLQGRPWQELLLKERLLLLDYAGQVVAAIRRMHLNGYIHRDITPNNFLVTTTGKLWMIDLELVYSETLQKPFPAFRLGTVGFMSPEQRASLTPTKAQDIYALGALLLFLFTGLKPYKFATETETALPDQIRFFISDNDFVKVLSDCFAKDPEARPELGTLITALELFKAGQEAKDKDSKKKLTAKPDRTLLGNMLVRALNGIGIPSLVDQTRGWQAQPRQDDDQINYLAASSSLYGGFYEGLSGILYVLAQAAKLGFPIDNQPYDYQQSCRFLRETYIKRAAEMPAGLYGGTAGMAIALAEGKSTGLIPDHFIRQAITAALKNTHTEGYGVVKGLAGQGMALLRVLSVIQDSYLQALLQEQVKQIVQAQQKDGSWLTTVGERKTLQLTGFGHGVAGIICFLLGYLSQYEDPKAEACTLRALNWLLQQSHENGPYVLWYVSSESHEINPGMQDGVLGIALTLAKAYQQFRDPRYRQIVENLLKDLPHPFIHEDLTLLNGLTGIGELYLEAAKVFGSGEWQQRSDYIADFLLHHFKQQEDGACYWLVNKTTDTTAGLMNGNSGIIHFLLRCYQPARLVHPLTGF